MFSFFSKPTTPPPRPPEQALPTFDDIIESRPDIRRLLITLTGRLDIPQMNDQIARAIVKIWPTRRVSPVTGQQVTQDEAIKELSSPCFIKDIHQIRADLKRIPEQFKSEGQEFIDKLISAVLFEVTLGFANHHEKEIRKNPDGTMSSVISTREMFTFGDEPCYMKMLKEDFDKLAQEEKQQVIEFYKKQGTTPFVGGKRRKTVKRKTRRRKSQRKTKSMYKWTLRKF